LYPKEWGKREVRIQRKLFGIYPRELLSPSLPSLPEAPVHQTAKKSFQEINLGPGFWEVWNCIYGKGNSVAQVYQSHYI